MRKVIIYYKLKKEDKRETKGDGKMKGKEGKEVGK